MASCSTQVGHTRSNENLVCRCARHGVWRRGYRRPVIPGDVQARRGPIIGGVCAGPDVPLAGLQTMPGRVRLLVTVHPQDGIRRLVKQARGRSSRPLRQQFPQPRRRRPALRTNSCFAATAGGPTPEVVKTYAENQTNA